MRYDDLDVEETVETIPEHEVTLDDGSIHIFPEMIQTVLETKVGDRVYALSFGPRPAEERMYPELVQLQKDVRHATFSRYLWERGVIDEAL